MNPQSSERCTDERPKGEPLLYRRAAQFVTLLAVTLALVLTASAAAANATRASATIATASSTDFRADLVARRAGTGNAPTAIVILTTFQRAGSAWHKLESKSIAGTFFWKTVTGPRAICRFELASAVQPHVEVQLLLTPSIGCGKTTSIRLPSR
jgi:hypothetical protein